MVKKSEGGTPTLTISLEKDRSSVLKFETVYFSDFVLGPTISTKFPSGSFNMSRQMS